MVRVNNLHYQTPLPFASPPSPVRIRRDGTHAVFPQLAVIAEDEVADRHRSPTNATTIHLVVILLLVHRQPQNRRVPSAIVRGHLVVRDLVRREPTRDRVDSRIESLARTLVRVTVVHARRKPLFEGHSVAESKRELCLLYTSPSPRDS